MRIAEKPLTATETAFGGEVEDHLVEWSPAVIVTPTVSTPTTVTATETAAATATATATTITSTTITATETLAASSKGNLERCWANAKTSPFLYLIPIGVLGAVVGELAKPYLGPINERLNQVNAQIAKSFGSSQGNALNAQLQATLNDPNVQRFGSIAAGVLALAAVGGLLYDWCSSEPGEAKTALGSSETGDKTGTATVTSSPEPTVANATKRS